MFSDDPRHPSSSDAPESGHRIGAMVAEIWQDWFEAMSEVAYQTHRACEFFIENGGPSSGRYGPFDFRSWRGAFEGSSGSIDIEKLKQCLQPMDPMQAAQVVHAVQMMQAMETMLKRQRSRAAEAGQTPW
jgi:hypothetical protein